MNAHLFLLTQEAQVLVEIPRLEKGEENCPVFRNSVSSSASCKKGCPVLTNEHDL